MNDCAHGPRGRLLIVAVTIGCLGWGAPVALADGLGPVPTGAFIQSRCAAMSLSPHVVHVGREVMGSAGPAVDACGPGGVQAISWSWAGGPGLTPFKGPCRNTPLTQPSSCTFKATAATGTPGHRFLSGCINGNSGFGGWISCDAYAVIGTDKRGISGTVLDHQGNPVTHAAVSIRGPGAPHPTTTDVNGFYSQEVDPGNYSVSVPGSQATVTRCTPGSASGTLCHLDLSQADGTANFVSCSAPHAAVDASAPAGDMTQAAASSAAPGACPLKVFVKVEGPIANVGTRSGLHVGTPRSGPVGGEGPVKFTTATLSKQGQAVKAVQTCLSGCANLLVTVIDPTTHKPPNPAATVTAELTGIDTPRPHMEGDQSLCTQSETPQTTRCGTKLADLSTDPKGQVHLIYWAPGTVGTLHTHLIVSATACTSPSASCPLGVQRGEAFPDPSLTVKPNPFLHLTGKLEPTLVKALINMVRQPTFFTELLGDKLKEHLIIVPGLEFLSGLLALSEHAVASVELPFAIVFAVADLGKAIQKHGEQAALMGDFLKAVGLSSFGLEVPPFATQLSNDPSEKLIQDFYSSVSMPGLGDGGLLQDLGMDLSDQYRRLKSPAVQPEHIAVTVYETSSCRSGAECGAGYYANNVGIQPHLCFDVTASNRLEPRFGFVYKFCLDQYNALAWSVSQSVVGEALKKLGR